MKLEASSFHNPRSHRKLTWGQKTDRLTPTLEESPRVRQSENEVSVSSYLSTFRWATPSGSIPRCAHTVLASPAARADTGLWRGDCSAVMIRRMGYGEVKLPAPWWTPCREYRESLRLYNTHLIRKTVNSHSIITQTLQRKP